MTTRRNRDPSLIEVNLTSLIDVTFLLIVFFVLVSRLQEVENIALDLPAPKDPASSVLEAKNQVVINVLPDENGAISAYRVGVHDFSADDSGRQSMIAHLADLYQTNPAINVNIRADRATNYEHVEPAIRAVSTAARLAAANAAAFGPQGARVNLVVEKRQ